MTRYRIQTETTGKGRVTYQPQRKLIWFIPFWEDIGICSPYDTEKEARLTIAWYRDNIDSVSNTYIKVD